MRNLPDNLIIFESKNETELVIYLQK